MTLVDTNVLISASFRIEDHEAAVDLITSRTDIVAPQLWRYEFLHVTTKQARLGKITYAQIGAALDYLLGHVLPDLHDEQLAGVVSTAQRHTCSGQDAVFLYWADTLNVPLVTRDRRLARAAPALTQLPVG